MGKTRAAEPVYLLASITKPMTVTGVMVLVDRGEVKLADPVVKYILSSKARGANAVLVRHICHAHLRPARHAA